MQTCLQSETRPFDLMKKMNKQPFFEEKRADYEFFSDCGSAKRGAIHHHRTVKHSALQESALLHARVLCKNTNTHPKNKGICKRTSIILQLQAEKNSFQEKNRLRIQRI